MNELENKEHYISFLVHLIEDMRKDVFLSNIEELNKLKDYPSVTNIINTKILTYSLND